MAPPPGVKEVFTSISIAELQERCNQTANDKGWWYEDDATPERTFGDMIALMHSELSECLEEFRNGHAVNEIYHALDDITKPEGIPVELADVIIRIVDFAEQYDIPLEAALILKMDYNDTRARRHGGKTI